MKQTIILLVFVISLIGCTNPKNGVVVDGIEIGKEYSLTEENPFKIEGNSSTVIDVRGGYVQYTFFTILVKISPKVCLKNSRTIDSYKRIYDIK